MLNQNATTSITHTQSTSTQQQTTQQSQLEKAVKRVEKAEFVQRFEAAYREFDGTVIEKMRMAQVLWNRLFCISGEPNALLNSSYPYKYLSDASCEEIISRCTEFGSGLDYRNLPQYFFPVQDETDPQGALTIIHFQMNDELRLSPWAVRYPDTDKKLEAKFINEHHQRFFETLWDNAEDTCDKKNLLEVSTRFYHQLQPLYTKIQDLKLQSREGREALAEMPLFLLILSERFAYLQKNSGDWAYNPVVWLSRVASMLMNPRLVDDNILFQIEEISSMDLANPLGIIKTYNALHYNGIIPTIITNNIEHDTWDISTFLYHADSAWHILPLSNFSPNVDNESTNELTIVIPSQFSKTAKLPNDEHDYAIFLYNYISLQTRAPALPICRSVLKKVFNRYGYASSEKRHKSIFRHGGVRQSVFLYTLFQKAIACCTGQNYIPEQAPYYSNAIEKLIADRDSYILQFHNDLKNSQALPLVDWALILRWSAKYTNNPVTTNVVGALNRLAGGKKLEETNTFLSAVKYLQLFGEELVTKDMSQQDTNLLGQATQFGNQIKQAAKGIALNKVLGGAAAEIAQGGEETPDQEIEQFRKKILRLNDLFISSKIFNLHVQVGNGNITLEDTHSDDTDGRLAVDGTSIEHHNGQLRQLINMIRQWNKWSNETYYIDTSHANIGAAIDFLNNTTGEKALQLAMEISRCSSSADYPEYDFVSALGGRDGYFSPYRICSNSPYSNYRMEKQAFVNSVNTRLQEARKYFNNIANLKFLAGVYDKFPRGSYQCVSSAEDTHWQTITTQQSKINLVTGGAAQKGKEQDKGPDLRDLFLYDQERLTIGFDGKPTTRPKALNEKEEPPIIVEPDRIQEMHILPILAEKLDKLSHVREVIAFHMRNMTGRSSLEALLQFLDHLAADQNINANTREVRILILTEMKRRFSSYFPNHYFDDAIENEMSAELTPTQQQRLKTMIGEDTEYDIIYQLLKQIHGYEREQNHTNCFTSCYYDELVTELRIIAQNNGLALAMACKSIKYFECDRQTAREICQHIIQHNSTEKAQQVQTNAQDGLKLAPSSRNAGVILQHLELVNQEPMKSTIATFSSTFIVEECIARLCLLGATNRDIGSIINNITTIRQTFSCTEHHLLSLAETAYKEGLHESFGALHKIAERLQDDIHATKRMFSILSYTQKQPALLPAFNALLTVPNLSHNIVGYIIVGYMDYLLRSSKEKPVNAIEHLTAILEKTSADKRNIVEGLLAYPPYPTLDKLQSIIESAEAAEAVKIFKQRPYERIAEHQFNKAECSRLKHDFTGVDSTLFEGEEWNNFIATVEANRNKTPHELKPLLRSVTDTEKLTYIIEQLARTAYQYTDDGRIVSQELNTTQVMALYSFIKMDTDKADVMAQIATGEGKSRIAIVYLAWQVLCHKPTIDLLTSNAALSERDFLAYSDLLTSLNIKSGLINMASASSEYVEQGINFSDNHSLFLQRLQGKEASDFRYDNTLLFVDEADTLFIDGRVHPYQIGEADDKSLLLPKLYEMVFQYYNYKRDASTLEGLKQHLTASIMGLTPAMKKVIKSSEDRKLQSLLNSCAQAYQMTCGDQYVISNDKQIVQTLAGQQRQRTILAMKKGRIQHGVIYEKGLHAFLALKENNGKGDIYIQPETTTTNNAFLVNLLQHYKQTFGITGTTDLERFKGLQQHGVHYLKIPELRENQRFIYRPIWTANQTEQLRQVKNLITEHPNRPILIFTKDDDALELFNALINKVKDTARPLNAIDAHASFEMERAAIDSAGRDNTITLSTAGRLGRGTDIKNPKGDLLAITTYLEDSRTKVQNESRTGRYGKMGMVQPVYNLSDYPHLTSSNQNLLTLSNLQEHDAQDQALTNKACDVFGLIRAQLQQHIPEDRLSDYWQYTTQEANRYYDLIKRLKCDGLALTSFTEALEREVETTLDLTYKMTTGERISIDEPLQTAFNNMVEFRRAADRGDVAEEKPADHYQRGDDGQKVVYTTGSSVWWEKVKATFRGERRPFADLIEWWNGTGHAYPHGIPAWLITLWVIVPLAAVVTTAYLWQPTWTMAIALQALAWVKGTGLPVTMHFLSTPLGLGIVGLVALVVSSLVITYLCQKPLKPVNRFEQNLLSSEQINQNGLAQMGAQKPSADLGEKKIPKPFT